MNKPLLQYKREIEEKIKKYEKPFIGGCDMCSPCRIEMKKQFLNKQLQMIDDIIEQKKKFERWLEIGIKEYEDILKSDSFNERVKEQAYSSILNYESVLDRIRRE